VSVTAWVVIYVIYGSSFLLLSASLAMALRKAVNLKLTRGFGYLAVFGALHALTEFCSLYLMLQEGAGPERASTALVHSVSVAILLLSYGFLLRFALTIRSVDETLLAHTLPWTMIVVLVLALSLSGHLDAPSLEHTGRWFLGTSSSVAAAAAMANLGVRFKRLGVKEMTIGAFASAPGFLFYGLLSAWHWPEMAGLPIQLCRAACACLITGALLAVLRGFRAQRPEG
jgi:hypothetical protein